MRHIITVIRRIAGGLASNFIILHPHILAIGTADLDIIGITDGRANRRQVIDIW
jgi:hypothetical protein